MGRRGAAAALPALPLREPPAPADLVLDRYSAAKVYLDGLCVEDVE